MFNVEKQEISAWNSENFLSAKIFCFARNRSGIFRKTTQFKFFVVKLKFTEKSFLELSWNT